MKSNSRRDFFKQAAGFCSVAVTAPFIRAGKAVAARLKERGDNYVGMFYDATLCIGCKACETACKEANGLPVEPDPLGIWDAPHDLSAKTMNIIKLYRDDHTHSFVKRQCLHCVDPSCVSACPTTAMVKGSNGVVVWDRDACVGCRYCQMACQFNIPKYEFEEQYGQIVKCELCSKNGLLGLGQTACTNACPTEAVIFGKQKSLLKIARKRLAANPEKYSGKVYGEKEAGGTGVLYLAGVPFEKLGLPDFPPYSNARVSEGIQHTLYQNMAAPIVIYFGLVLVAFKNLRKKLKKEREE